MSAKWIAWIKRNPTVLLVLLLAAGVILLFFPASSRHEQVTDDRIDLKQETESYRTQLTEEIEELLKDIRGVGEVRLLITFSDSIEYEYLKERNENTDSAAEEHSRDYSESYLMVEDHSGKTKVLEIRRILPQVSGAAVVCEGGSDPLVKQQVIELLRAVLGVSAADISVLPLA